MLSHGWLTPISLMPFYFPYLNTPSLPFPSLAFQSNSNPCKYDQVNSNARSKVFSAELIQSTCYFKDIFGGKVNRSRMFSEISLNGTPKPILRLTLWLKACDFYPRCFTFTNFRPVSHLSFDLRISLFFYLFLCRGCFKKVSPTFRFTS